MISMDQYGTVAFFLLLIAFLLTGLFSMYVDTLYVANCSSKDKTTPSGAIAAMILAVPASIFFGYSSYAYHTANRRFGVVWLFLAVGVYV